MYLQVILSMEMILMLGKNGLNLEYYVWKWKQHNFIQLQQN